MEDKKSKGSKGVQVRPNAPTTRAKGGKDSWTHVNHHHKDTVNTAWLEPEPKIVDFDLVGK
jgi:hypothetical protein